MTFGTLVESLNNQEEYRGKFFLGTVVSNDDPEGLDRIKISVLGLYDEEDACPWVGPAKFSSFGEGPGYGVYGSPIVGSQVLVTLQDGDPHYPVYLGSLLAAGTKTKSQRLEFHNSAWGFVDPTGNKLLIDMATETLTFIHSSLVSFVIQNGTLTVTTPQDLGLAVVGNLNAAVQGNVTATVDGSLSATVAGTASLVADGTVSIQGSTIQLNEG